MFGLTCYDNMGRVERTSNPFRGTIPSNPCDPQNGLEWTTPTYDALGRTTRVTTPDTAHVDTAYSVAVGTTKGTVVTVTDQAGKPRRSITDALGHLIRVDEPTAAGLGTNLDSPNQPTSYAYDLLNNLTTVTQGEQTRTFQYDACRG